jgi:hypothetical protein
MVYRRYAGSEQYIIAINPSDRTVDATIPTRHASDVRYVLGTTSSSRYTAGPSTDRIELPPISAAVYRVK